MRRAKAAIAAFFAMTACVLPVFSQEKSQKSEPAVNSCILTITDRESRTIAEIPLQHGRFDHVFVHSIHLTPVVERFEVTLSSDRLAVLHLFELDYESCGLGMPSDTENGFSLVDGKFILEMSRDFVVIPLMVSVVAGHGIVADGHFYPFTDWVPQETLLFLTARAVY